MWPTRRFEVVPTRRGGWVLRRWQGPVVTEDWFEADPDDEADLAIAYDCAVADGEAWVAAGESWTGEGTAPAPAGGGS